MLATDGARWRDAVDPEVEDRLAAAVDELALLPAVDDVVALVIATDPGPQRRAALETATHRLIAQAPGRPSTRVRLHAAASLAAAAALTIADRTGLDPDVPHLAALLHEAGTLVLALAFDMVARPGADPRAERAQLGIDHAAAGAMLAERWNLPQGVPEAIALHHGGPDDAVPPPLEVAAVQVAAQIPGLTAGRAHDRPLLRAALLRCGAGAALLDELVAAARGAQPSAWSSPRSVTRPASSVL